MTTDQDLILFDGKEDVVFQDGESYIQNYQELPDDFLQILKDERHNSAHQRAGEFHHVASIPVKLMNHVIRQGIDPTHIDWNWVLKWLRENGYENLIATSKNITFEVH